jgi:DNA/RNA endonuclease G (NUC1)
VLLCKENENWHGIAFIFPNENVRGPLADYATTISELEKEADLLFAPKLPREIQNGTKHRFDSQFWATVLKDD